MRCGDLQRIKGRSEWGGFFLNEFNGNDFIVEIMSSNGYGLCVRPATFFCPAAAPAEAIKLFWRADAKTVLAAAFIPVQKDYLADELKYLHRLFFRASPAEAHGQQLRYNTQLTTQYDLSPQNLFYTTCPAST